MQERAFGVSLILCTYNGATRLGETLRCLAKQQVAASMPWEVIFVDNASTDGSAQVALDLWKELGAPAPLRQLHEPRPGYKVAMQHAIKHIGYRYACIVDDDNRLDINYIKTGVEILEAYPIIGVLGGPNTATFEVPEPSWFAEFQHCYASGPQLNRVKRSFAPLSDGPVGQNVLWGAGMFVRSEVWDQLQDHGFTSLFTGRQGEKNLTAGEDDELCYAAQLLGYQVWYSTRLHLHHYMTATRLTEAYRDKLFYASALATPRLNAYRNALWGRADGDVNVNIVKDLVYIVWGILNYIRKPSFVRACLNSNNLVLMNLRHTILVVKETIFHYRQIRKYYKQVLHLKKSLLSPAPSLSAKKYV